MDRRKFLATTSLLALETTVLSKFGKAAATAPDAIKVGMCLSITGKMAAQYNVMGRWVQATTDLFNQKGGVYVKEFNKRIPVKTIWYDDKSDPATCIKFYERLVNVDHVHFLLGPTSSPQGIAGSTVAEKYKIPMVLTSSNDPKIFARNFRWISSCLAKSTEWCWNYYHMLKEQTNAKTVAMITEDTVWALGIRDGIQEITKRLGLQVVYDKLAPSEAQDVTPLILDLKKLNPDVICIPAFIPLQAVIFKQAFDQQLKPKAFHGCNAASPAFVDSVGLKRLNYVTGEIYWTPGEKFEGWEIMEAARKKANVDIAAYPIGPANNFASQQILYAAIEQAGTLDRTKVQVALETMSCNFIGGVWKRSADGAGTYNPSPMQFIDGERYPVYPSQVALRKFVYPAKWSY